MSVDSGVAASFQQKLLAWFQREKRDLPWRRATDPFHIFAAEIMLQQTQSATAVPYYERFLKRFPDIQTLAESPLDEVYQQWQGLGYYSRARRLHDAAKIMMDRFDGQVPDTAEELMSLPGVGRYTAGAVASSAYQVAAPVVDGNVMRVLTRVFRVKGNPKTGAANKRLWEIAEALVPDENPKDFNAALMELGSLVCSPRKPNCGGCPVSAHCGAFEHGETDRFPETPPRPKTTALTHVSAMIMRGRRFLLTQRPDGGPGGKMWAGLWELPRVERGEGETVEDAAERAGLQVCGVRSRAVGSFGSLRHSVTRYRIHLHGVHAEWLGGDLEPLECKSAVWTDSESWSEYALSSPQRRLIGKAFDNPSQNLLFS